MKSVDDESFRGLSEEWLSKELIVVEVGLIKSRFTFYTDLASSIFPADILEVIAFLR